MPFAAKTLLFVGAGASRELEFPAGPQLKDQIRSCTNVRWDGFQLQGDQEFCAIAEDLARTYCGGQLQPILDACSHIHSNVLLSGSIDQFLSSHQDDELVVRCAKLAIAHQIAKAERACHLNTGTQRPDHTDFVYLKDTYLPRLWSRLQSGEPIRNWKSFFDSVRIVTFNYDRVIEQFLVLALERFCRISAHEATEFVADLPIVHVYGSLGSLKRSSEYCQFAPSRNEILKTSERILTFSETVNDNVREEIAEHVHWADVVIFLGFSYANVNLGLLPADPQPTHEVLGTAFEMSGPNRKHAQAQLNRRLDKLLNRTILADCTCAKLFDDYELRL